MSTNTTNITESKGTTNDRKNQVMSEYINGRFQMMVDQYPALEQIYNMTDNEFFEDPVLYLENFKNKPVRPFPNLDDLILIQQPLTQERMAEICADIDEKCTINFNNDIAAMESKRNAKSKVETDHPCSRISLYHKFQIIPYFSSVPTGIVGHSITSMKVLGHSESIDLKIAADDRIVAVLYIDDRSDTKQAFLVASKDEQEYYFELSEFCMLISAGKNIRIQTNQTYEIGRFIVFNKELGLVYINGFISGSPDLRNAKLQPITGYIDNKSSD